MTLFVYTIVIYLPFLCSSKNKKTAIMKITILFLTIILFTGAINAQTMAYADKKNHLPASDNSNNTESSPAFIFTNYGIDLNHTDLTDYPQHILGDKIARKIYATQKIYVQKHDASIGFTDNTMEIFKPAIYNAILKLESHFKKAVRRQTIDAQTAQDQLAKCLDVAYMAYYEEKTVLLEKTLKKAKTAEELYAIFNSVIIKE